MHLRYHKEDLQLEPEDTLEEMFLGRLLDADQLSKSGAIKHCIHMDVDVELSSEGVTRLTIHRRKP